jgi:hypothetical protein
MIDRRTLLSSGMAVGAALIARAKIVLAEQPDDHSAHGGSAKPPAGKLTKGLVVPGETYAPVVMPNGRTLPFEKKEQGRGEDLPPRRAAGEARDRAGSRDRSVGL